MDNLNQALKQFIKTEFVAGNDSVIIEDDTSLIKEGIIDSLGIFVLINFIDEQFQLKIQPEEILLQNFESVNTLTALLDQKVKTNTLS